MLPLVVERAATRLRQGARAAALVSAAAAALATAACERNADSAARGTPRDSTMNEIAEAYVHLVLAVGQHDPDYVDAYYGPPEWRVRAQSQLRPLQAIRQDADSLIARLADLEVAGADELVALRAAYLDRQLNAVRFRVRMLEGEQFRFDEEARGLYDVDPPQRTAESFDSLLAQLDPLLPGTGSVPERYAQFRSRFVIPPERVDTVFRAAIAEARRRTLAELELPESESFTLEYVTGKTWSGYNWYQGNAASLIQINTDLPITIDRAIDLAAHEGYPGHHVYNVLLEEHLVRRRGWVEFSVYPLFSPQSLIAEGSANFGIAVAFPGDERVRFERDTLYPLAGLDPAQAETYARVQELSAQLSYAGNEAARRYLDGSIDATAAADWLVRYALMPRDRAEQRVRFIDQYRSYVINYNYGQDLVRDWVVRNGGTADRADRRWQIFASLLSSPRLPSGLQ